MKGGTLVVSRCVTNHWYYQKRFEDLGYPDVTVTALDKDALDFLIRELKPKLIIMGARFYQCCTPFFMGELKRKFPNIKMAGVCIGEYPVEIAMYFKIYGGNSYVTSYTGIPLFYEGLEEIRKGNVYHSPGIDEHIEMRTDFPEFTGTITGRNREVLRLVCCGFNDIEIADELAIHRNTVKNYKTELFTIFNVRGSVELVLAVLTLEIIKLNELYFYPKDYTLNPLPEINIEKLSVNRKQKKDRREKDIRNLQKARKSEQRTMSNEQ
jgi:DNA-binding NarL/FixJ family response regulator